MAQTRDYIAKPLVVKEERGQIYAEDQSLSGTRRSILFSGMTDTAQLPSLNATALESASMVATAFEAATADIAIGTIDTFTSTALSAATADIGTATITDAVVTDETVGNMTVETAFGAAQVTASALAVGSIPTYTDGGYIGAIRTVVGTIGAPADVGVDDAFTSVANMTPQVIDLDVPAFAHVLDVSVVTLTGLAGASSIEVIAGATSGTDEYVKTAEMAALNARAALADTAFGVPLSAGASKVYFSFTPDANWSSVSAGRWLAMVSYIDIAGIKTAVGL